MTTEGTQVKEQENEIVEAWLRAEKAPEPGTVAFEGLIKDPELPTGVSMKFSTLINAGRVPVYHTKTGDRSVIPQSMLRAQLQKRLPKDEGGGYAFSINPPKDAMGNIIKPVQGTIKCMLHKDDPNRKLYDQMGFAVCPKDNITSQHSLVQHMKHRHHVEYETIEKIRTDAEKLEERTFQKALYTRMTEAQPVVVKQEIPQGVAPLYVSAKKVGRPKKK